ncbi:MAG: hypothetical protein KJ771_08590 [Nanoarchaeota archaeon]|nr:hypothetical protein [Nanoarchaeota archaeon]
MAELILRVKGQTVVHKEKKVELINLEDLVHAGTELISLNSSEQFANDIAKETALQVAKSNGCDYVLLGSLYLQFNKSLRDVPNYVYVATFYNKKQEKNIYN